MKKLCTLFLMLALLVSVSAPLSAAAPEEAVVISDLETAAAYAYLDLETASPELADTILAARNTIIYHSTWVADGYKAQIVDVATGEVLEEVPTFSELCPGWDIPVETPAEEAADLTPQATEEFPCTVYLSRPRDGVLTKPFLTLPTLGKSLYTYATYLQNSATYNLGYANGSTGKSLGYASQIPLGAGYRLESPGYIQCSVRASTYSTPGNARLVIVR